MKINLGRQTSGKKYLHKLPSSITTTSQFGFCQPYYCRESIAQDHYKIRQASAVRLQPVVKPTFGRLFMKQYTSFVPFEEIWHPWGSFLDGKPYSGALEQYIPTVVPSLSLRTLMFFSMCMSELTFFKTTGSSYDSLRSFSFGCRELISDTSFSVFDEFKNALDYLDFPSYVNDVIDTVSGVYLTGNLENSIRFVDVAGKFDWILPYIDGDSGTNRLIAGRFSNRGKNFYKILVGLGYQFLYSDDIKSILPLVAFYKMYFDLFQPQRFTTWKETNAYTFMEYIEQSNDNFVNILSGTSGSRIKDAFLDFIFKDLTEAYYTQDTDFAAAHIDGTGIATASNFDYLNDSNQPATVLADQNAQPYIDLNTESAINQNALDILKALYHRVNISTALGGKIKEFMQVIFGADYKQDDETNFVGANTVPIDITDVMSTAETSEGYLGEYAGKGIGFDPQGKPLEFTCSRQGFMISFFALVPEARLCQAVDPNLSHTQKCDFFQSGFDALTLLPTRKSAIFGQTDIIFKGSSAFKNGFGNIPNFTEYKVSFDKLNGELSMRSTRDSLLPFSMSKYISPSFTQLWPDSITEGRVTGSLFLNAVDPSLITNGLIWRFIGLDNWLGNFNRIFVNQGFNELQPEESSPISPGQELAVLDNVNYRIDDNFVVYLYCDVEVYSQALALADSFQTDSFSDHISVQKQ